MIGNADVRRSPGELLPARSRASAVRAGLSLAALLGATLFVAACSSPSPSPPLRNPEAEQVAHQRELELMRIDLVGPTWGLVQIHWMGGGAAVPSQPGWYTLQFSDDGQVQVRADCNRGHGAWTTTGRGKLQLGPLAVTRAFCGDDPVNRRFLPDLEKVRSVEFTETRMRLIAPVDDVVLEFEPLSTGN